MPVVSTLALGQAYLIVNNSSGAITVNSSGGNLIQTMAANTSLLLYAGLITGTTAASWQVVNYATSDTSYPLSIALGGTGVSSVTVSPAASAWAGWDANKNLSANNAYSIIYNYSLSGRHNYFDRCIHSNSANYWNAYTNYSDASSIHVSSGSNCLFL